MDLKTKQWIPKILDWAAPDLGSKLGNIVPSHTSLGPISSYFSSRYLKDFRSRIERIRYGFASNCMIIAFSGDNPCSVAGLRMKVHTFFFHWSNALSKATLQSVLEQGSHLCLVHVYIVSDTIFGPLQDPHPSAEGHVFCDPVHPDGYMALLCYKNGSLTREYIR